MKSKKKKNNVNKNLQYKFENIQLFYYINKNF